MRSISFRELRRSGSSRTKKPSRLPMLVSAFNDVSEKNEEYISKIIARQDSKVVCGYSSYIKCSISGNGNDNKWSFNTMSSTILVSERLENWEYNGEPLEKTGDVVDNGINYVLRTWEDLVRLNIDIVNMIKPANCKEMNKLLRNAKRIRKALEELWILSNDMH